MKLVVRPMRLDEARVFLDIHNASVRGLAVRDYPAEVIDAWAPKPMTNVAFERFLVNWDHELRLIAWMGAEPVGVGALVLQQLELRACYVLPRMARKGIGSALVKELERIAQEHGLTRLHLASSLTAEPFFRELGYQAVKRRERLLRSDVRMVAVQMQKQLDPNPLR